MARIKVKFTLNPGREGISWAKLAKQSETIQSLLSSISDDLGLQSDKWLARDFADGSYMSNAELEAVATASEFAKFNDYFRGLISYIDEDAKTLNTAISKKSVAIFSELRTPLDIDEPIGIGLYDPSLAYDRNANPVESFTVTKLKLQEIASSIEAETTYIGSVIGYTYEWNKGAKEPYLKIRDIASQELIKCSYSDRDYKKVAALFEHKESLVIVYGLITYDWVNQKTELKKATDFEIAPTPLSDSEYNSFFGCAAGMTGKVNAAQYVRKMRGNK